VIFIAVLIVCLTSTGVQAQENANAAAEAAMKKDNTGTNPINFTHDLRIFHEYQFLNTPGDGDQQVTTLAFRTPFHSGKWQFRVRARGQQLNIDTNDDGIDEVNEGGTGDWDMRILTVPILDMKNKFALAAGFETFQNRMSAFGRLLTTQSGH
jgi:hypothetical protein